ncbi:MAG: M3 family oligoendopeptidase [Planctomycetota bacterium]|jgi:oligoendopeptidase F
MELTKTPDVAVPPYRFVPSDFDPADLAALEGLVASLVDRPLPSPGDLRRWIVDWGELSACVGGEYTRRMTAMNRDTRSPERRERFLAFQTEVMPAWERHEDKLNHRYLESPHRADVGEEFAVFDREKAKAAEIYREKNTELSAQVEALGARFQEIQGGMTVEFGGETLTMEQCGAKLQETDRKTRREAYLAVGRRLLEERDRLDEIFDEQIRLRHAMARNAGFDDFSDLRHAEMNRFDYTPADCAVYRDAVEKVVVPALRELRAGRRRRLGVETLRPYDMEVSLFGCEPKRLFDDQEGYVALVAKVFQAVDPAFARAFDVLVRNELLDLMSRPGKAPGGYNAPLDDIRLPFIFYNAVGRRGDLRTMLHEGGHAFHTLAARDLDIQPYRAAPMEFCEVASMSMELFGFERLDGVLGPEEYREFARTQFEGIISVLAHVALVDAFQAWLYAHPDHDREARRAQWLALTERFVPGIDHTGLEEFRANSWQRIPHVFLMPLYFIEYGIAEIGALQMWRRERHDHDGAVAGYRRALALGGSRPLPELFAAAGIRFAMDEEVLRELVPEVMEKLREVLGPG